MTETFSKDDIEKALRVALKLKGFKKDQYVEAIRFVREFGRNSDKFAAKHFEKFRPAKCLVEKILNIPTYNKECEELVKLRLRVEKNGIQVDFDGSSIELVAPDGYCFVSNDSPTYYIRLVTCFVSLDATPNEIKNGIESEISEISRGLYKILEEEQLFQIENELGQEWKAPDNSPDFIKIDKEF